MNIQKFLLKWLYNRFYNRTRIAEIYVS